MSADLAPSMWKSPAIAIVRFWCAKTSIVQKEIKGGGWVRPRPRRPPLVTVLGLMCDVVGSYAGTLCLLVWYCVCSLSWSFCVQSLYAVMIVQQDRLRVGPNFLGFQ